MATSYSSPKIVTDGLVFYVDTMNNKSFVSGSSRITNLGSSQISASINSAHAREIIGGTQNSISTAPTPSFQSGINLQLLTNFPELNFTRADNFTMCVWASYISGSDPRGVFARGSYNGFIGIYAAGTGVSIGTRVASGVTANVSLKNPIRTGSNAEIFNAVMVYKSSSMDGYLNGQFIGSVSTLLGESTFAEGTPSSYAHNSYGGIGGNGGPGTMSFYNASIYNRALSADEVRQNFNALRPRYGV